MACCFNNAPVCSEEKHLHLFFVFFFFKVSSQNPTHSGGTVSIFEAK